MMNSLLFYGAISSIMGLAGYKYYRYREQEKEFERMYQSFIEYDERGYFREHHYDEFAPFRVYSFNSIYDETDTEPEPDFIQGE